MRPGLAGLAPNILTLLECKGTLRMSRCIGAVGCWLFHSTHGTQQAHLGSLCASLHVRQLPAVFRQGRCVLLWGRRIEASGLCIDSELRSGCEGDV